MRRKLWILVCAGVVLGLAQGASPAQAFLFCKNRTTSTTYYEPVGTACSPCGPPQPSAVVPVTVTTRRVGLFGLRKRTTVTVGAAVPLAVPASPAFVPPPPPATLAPVNSAYPPVMLSPH